MGHVQAIVVARLEVGAADVPKEVPFLGIRRIRPDPTPA